MSLEFWKIAASLGVPGFALAVFYGLFKQFKFDFPKVKQQWVGPIIILFIAAITFITYQAIDRGFATANVKEKVGEKKVIDRDLAEALTSSLHELESNLAVLNSYSALYNERAERKSNLKINYSKSMSFFTRYFDLVFPVTYGEAENLIPFLSALSDAEGELNTIKTKDDISNFNKKNHLSMDDLRLLTGFYIFYLDGLIENYLPKEFTYTYDSHYEIYTEKGDVLVMNEFTLDGKPVKEYTTVLGLLD